MRSSEPGITILSTVHICRGLGRGRVSFHDLCRRWRDEGKGGGRNLGKEVGERSRVVDSEEAYIGKRSYPPRDMTR